ncbi:MAG: uracil-DNA glycosylase [Zoogloeaceae bacterium]|nr:uracil-DNA glycosylase [Rhodocyclaceae bacterium]MCP5254048.1 uracil-DNA glycosylase [Zoogloeaceae bacterium]
MSATRESMLREMGLGPLWRLRGASQEAPRAVADHTSGDDSEAVREVAAAAIPQTPPTRATGGAAVRRPAVPPRMAARLDAPQPRTPPLGARQPPSPGGLDWSGLERAISDCTACSLCERRKLTVPGVGDRRPTWLMVGEGPGAEEDQKGEPFVGQAGRLLDAMLASIGASRAEGIFIANAVKCRPPGNRTPASEELAACFPFLERQIELLQPKLIIALGRPAAQVLLKREIRIAGVRGETHDYKGIPLIVTYHPAYLLRNQGDKAKAWADLCLAKRLVPLPA